MDHNYTGQYKNVTLLPLSEEHIESLRNWRNNSENTKFLRSIPFITPEMQENWYNSYLLNEDELCFVIYENQALNRVVGSLSLYNFQGKQAEFGKILIGDMEAHGKSVGYHAILAVLKIAFDEMMLETVVLRVYDENIAAKHIYEKAGFQKVDSKSINNRIEDYMELQRNCFVDINNDKTQK